MKRWFAGLFATDTAYAKPPAWAQDGALPPGLASHSIPAQAWENGLKKFKVSFEIVRNNTGQESPQSGIKDDIIYYYHNDHLGTPCFLTDETGAIVWRREQTPFGETSYERGTTTENLRFPGQYYDAETGLAQNWHRDYNAVLGRYVESDPIGRRGGLNLFLTFDNNPLKYSDLYGLFKTKDEAAIAALQEVSKLATSIYYEYGGFIYNAACGSGEPDYEYTSPTTINEPYAWNPTGNESPDPLDLKNDGRLIATYHTHLTQRFPTDPDDYDVISKSNGHLAGYNLERGYIGVISTSGLIVFFPNHVYYSLGKYK